MKRASINDYISKSCWMFTEKLWCPAVVTARSESVLSVMVVRHKVSELPGLEYWLKAGDQAAPANWKVPIVKDWVDHPDRIVPIHIDRATYVIFNGMLSSAAEIRIGDHLGIEFRPEQTADALRPFFIFVYRYTTAQGHDQSLAGERAR